MSTVIELPDGFGPENPSKPKTQPKYELGEGFDAVYDYKRSNLNVQQYEAAYSDPTGVVLVMAGAGSGKTSGVILPRTEHLYFQNPGKIAILAFNRAIKEELADKVAKTTHPTVAQCTKVYTNHGIGYQLVMRNLELLHLPPKTSVEEHDWKIYQLLKEQIIEQSNIPVAKRNPAFCQEFRELEEVDFKALLKVEEVALSRGEEVSEVLKKFSRILDNKVADEVYEAFIPWARFIRWSSGRLMFRDFLPLALMLPQDCYTRLGFKHLLVDEAQDLSVDQHAVIQKLCNSAESLTFVGDAAQCVFRFNGARPDLFTGITDRYPYARVYMLETNYRSDQPILDLANILLGDYIKTDIHLRPPEPRPGIPIIALDSPKSLVPWIKGQLASGVRPEEIAVLHRTNAHALSVEIALSIAGIPYQCRAGSFFDHKAVQDIMAYVKFLHNSRKKFKDDWKVIVNHSKYLGEKTVDSSWEESKGNPMSMTQPPSGCRSHNQKKLWQDLISKCRVMHGQINNPQLSGSEIINSIYENKLKSVWKERWSDDPDKIEEAVMIKNALIDWSKEHRNCEELLLGMAQLSLQDDGGVMLSTVHRAKGLEWPHVAVWNLGLGTFPLDHDGVNHEEEMCILYVAVTRARKTLVLVRSEDTRGKDSLLHHLSEEQNRQLTNLMSLIDDF